MHAHRRLRQLAPRDGRRLAIQAAKVANPQVESETHKAALMEFRKQVAEYQPKLAVETGLIALDGKIEMFS
jgi:hypothetical protein